jgi:hypothetical protein
MAPRVGLRMACAAGVQASLYLTVLTVNSALLVGRRLVEPPGESPIWEHWRPRWSA